MLILLPANIEIYICRYIIFCKYLKIYL